MPDPTPHKAALLKPRLLDSVNRLKRLVELDAPAVIIGHEAWLLYKTTLACYGDAAASTMVSQIREAALESRGICHFNDCTNPVDRPETGICQSCLKSIGADDESLDQLLDPEKNFPHKRG